MVRTSTRALLCGAAAIMMMMGPAIGAEIDAPRATAKAVLAGYTKAGKTDTGTFDACPQFCDPSFAKIIARVGKLGSDGGDTPFDGDIFCSCQDYDHQTFFIVSDKLKTPVRFEAVGCCQVNSELNLAAESGQIDSMGYGSACSQNSTQSHLT